MNDWPLWISLTCIGYLFIFFAVNQSGLNMNLISVEMLCGFFFQKFSTYVIFIYSVTYTCGSLSFEFFSEKGFFFVFFLLWQTNVLFLYLSNWSTGVCLFCRECFCCALLSLNLSVSSECVSIRSHDARLQPLEGTRRLGGVRSAIGPTVSLHRPKVSDSY